MGLRQQMLIQRGHLFGWCPVGMACGIAVFLGLRFEPSLGLLCAVVVVGCVSGFVAFRADEAVSPLAIFVAMVALGFVLIAGRAHMLAAPVLDWRYYGPVEGRIIGIDRSASDALRLTLDHVVLDRTDPDDTPARVRISLHGDDDLGVRPQPGLHVMTTAHLSPPGGPVEPGGFDFQRHAWFAQLGAVGYTRVPLVAIRGPEFDLVQMIFRIRMAVSLHVTTTLPGDVGGFAAAVTTGDRSAISQDALHALRASNTAHLLAISGLHMGLLAGFVFGALRLVFAAIPRVALYWPARKFAAVGALVSAAVYLALSGGNVATERAFVMVAVALGAVMIDRRAISLRAVALAAMIVLFLRPEALVGPGFQMSFAATTALVAVFGLIRDQSWSFGPRWLQPVLGVAISSAIAGLATAPIGAAHFNTIAHYGLVANLASVPVMGLLVVPSAVLALVLSPFGLDWIGLWLMGVGLRWILWVASTVSDWGGAQGFVAGPDTLVLPLIVLGGLFVVLWQGRLRCVGLAPVVLGFALWQSESRPQILIAQTGGLVGYMTSDGRALSRDKGSGFVARNWLENDGDGVDQIKAAARWSNNLVPTVKHIVGKRGIAQFNGCKPDQIVVSSIDQDSLADLPCLLLTPAKLRHTGSVAINFEGKTPVIQTARDITGDRMWTGWDSTVSPSALFTQ